MNSGRMSLETIPVQGTAGSNRGLRTLPQSMFNQLFGGGSTSPRDADAAVIAATVDVDLLGSGTGSPDDLTGAATGPGKQHKHTKH